LIHQARSAGVINVAPTTWDQYSKSPSPSTGEGGGEGDLEERCFATAWAAVKNKYRKEGDWMEIQENKFCAIILKEISSEAPAEFQLLPNGRIDIEGDLPAYVDAESARLILEHQRRRGNDMVIDYEHQTLKDIEAPAAGWIKKMIDKGSDGIWAAVDWTKKGKDYLTNKEYRFFSPVILIRAADRKVVAILNVALTNFPKLNNLRTIIA
jgi:phage I-like protein